MTKDLKGKLFSTVVGSFPYKVSRELMGQPEWREVEEISRTSHKALKFQLDCGIDFPSDGQFYDMVAMYLKPLITTGFLNEDRTIGEGELPKEHPATSLEAELEEEARRRGASGLRVPITGPFSLGYRVKGKEKSLVEEGDSKGIEKLAEAVKAYCKGFDISMKGSILSVDEPVLPYVLPTFGEEFVKETMNGIFESIEENYTCMHVCGGVQDIKDLALSLKVDILDHEFQGTDNLGLYSKEELEDNDKLLSYGVINTNPRQIVGEGNEVQVESVEELQGIIRNACDIYGKDNLMLSPDCGFGGWKTVKLPDEDIWKYIGEKLTNMVKARDLYLA